MEIWKQVKDYEGLYEVSSLGRVKSLKFGKEKILKPILNGKYFKVTLSRTHKIRIHQLVAITFLGHTPCGMDLVIDHINGDYLDNRVENLQLISQRENTSKSNKVKTSIFTGVSWGKATKKWRSSIRVNGKNIYLGLFNCELSASIAYQNKLREYGL